MPNGLTKMIYDGVLNIVFLTNILLTSSVIAFNMHTFDYFFLFEYVVDWIVFSDLILTFFTAFPEKQGSDPNDDEVVYVTSLGKIILNYLKTYFWTDFIGVVPCLVAETICVFYWGWTPRFLGS
jgi:hypothetical protein